MKVFCKDCRWFFQNPEVFEHQECRHSNNFIVVESFYGKNKIPYKPPKMLNRNNDCKWYKKANVLQRFLKYTFVY